MQFENLFEPDPNRPQSKGPREPYQYLLIDGGGLVVTAWATHRELERPEDRVKAAIYVFITVLSSLTRLMAEGAAVVVVWDGYDNRAFRRGRHPWYKHGRGTVIDRDEIRIVMKELAPLLNAVGVAQVKKDKHEADDVIATISLELEHRGYTSLVFSDDKDFYQLVSDKVHQCRRSMDGIIVDPDQGILMGVMTGEHYLDVKSVMGDSGDNIKGLQGIGEKKAQAAIKYNPDLVTQCINDPETVDWDEFDDGLLRAFVRAGRRLVYPPKPTGAGLKFAKEWGKERGIKVTDPDVDEAKCLEAAAREIAWSYDLVAMDRGIIYGEVEFPAVNAEAIPAQLRRLDMLDETDLLMALYTMAGAKPPPGQAPPRRAAVRAGDAIATNPDDIF